MNDLLKFITCGSVDDGKSTLIGHILYSAKLLFADQKEALLLDSKVGSRGGDIDYSLLLDGLTAEREQGITIDIAYRYFTTDHRSFIVADAPGHEEYTRNMAVGASFADLAIILLDSTQGVLVQTKRHARICKLMGIRYFVFAVNKMDLSNYSEEVFRDIERQIADLSEELNLPHVKIIPVSATVGDNVTEPSEHMPWYSGEPILTYLENVDIRDADTEQGFYLPVQRVCRPDHTFRGFQGQVESGSVSVGDTITALPSRESAAVNRLYVGDTPVKTATIGQPVTVTLDKEIDVSRGCVLTSSDSNIGTAKAFTATLLWMDEDTLTPGKEYFVKLGTKRLAGQVKSIVYRTDINSGKHLEADSLSKNEIALCEIHLDEEIAIDTFANHKTLGELILIDRITNMTSACGVVEELLTEEENGVFISGNGITAKTLLFDEFFYNEKSLRIDNYTGAPKSYAIGDTIGLKGESYDYPAYFDILAIDSAAAVSIRDGVVENVLPLGDYRYTGLPVVDEKGFAINIPSREDLSRFLGDLKHSQKQKLYETWMNFETFRRVIFTSNFWGL